MTDPADHQARMREIEARLRRSTPAYALPPDSGATLADSDLRYLLDRVRALEEVVRYSAVFLGESQWNCSECEAWAETRESVQHDQNCIVLTLPAPEPVETQNAAP